MKIIFKLHYQNLDIVIELENQTILPFKVGDDIWLKYFPVKDIDLGNGSIASVLEEGFTVTEILPCYTIYKDGSFELVIEVKLAWHGV